MGGGRFLKIKLASYDALFKLNYLSKEKINYFLSKLKKKD